MKKPVLGGKKKRPSKVGIISPLTDDISPLTDDIAEQNALFPIFRRSMFWKPERDSLSAWAEHVPFAFWLVDVLRPSMIVELGTHTGVSYSAMCQAVKFLGLSTRCFAVDTWKGDEHAKYYGEEVFSEFATFHDQHFASFSRLVRSTFDEALAHFEDQSIDLLHIDGLHTYESVRHDFESWLPKLKRNGIVMFHDINVRELNFGVFQLWEEISAGRLHFEFYHGHGLGVLGLGSEYPGPLRLLFNAAKDRYLASSIRTVFAHLGRSNELSRYLTDAHREMAVRAQEVEALKQTITDRDAKAAALDQEAQALKQAIAERDTKVAALDQEAQTLRQAVTERDVKVAVLGHAVQTLKQAVTNRDTKVAALDQEAQTLRQAVTERDVKMAALDQTLAERDREQGGLWNILIERDVNIASLGEEIVSLRSQLAGKAAELDRLFASTSWHLTSPIRKARVKISHVALLGTKRVELRPLNQLKREAQIDSVTEWRMTGDDPYFDVDLSRTGPLPVGHYRLMIELPNGLIGVISPNLYVDSGNGLSGDECLSLNFELRDRIGIASFSLGKGARSLRFDPSVIPGRIGIGRVWLRRMSRIEHYSRMIARLVEYRINSPADLALAVKRTIAALAAGGPHRLTAVLRSVVSRDVGQRDDYQRWIDRYDTMTEADKDALRRRMQSLARPLISVIMPVYNTPQALLRSAIESVREQINDHWELCIADDCSTIADVREVLDYYARLDSRIRVCFRAINGGIAEASNSALAIAKGEFVALLDHDDEISPAALALVAETVAAHPDVDLIFSDEDKLDTRGRRFNPYFKPQWNPALMLSQNFFSHLGVYRCSLVGKLGGFRLGFDGAQDHDLVLRCSRETTPERIRHIPKILYHWRAIKFSTAADGSMKSYAWDAGRRAIEEHLAEKHVRAKVERAPLAPFHYQVEYAVPTPPPRVSILIPTTAKPELIKTCLDSILEHTTYDNFEVLLLVGETHRAMPDRAAYLSWASQQPRVRILLYPDRPFNFSWVNNWGTGHATGDILCLLNDDTEIITREWLERLVARVSLDGIGAVGPMMYYPDNTIQHAGVILGIGGVAGHVFGGTSRGYSGYFNRACLEQDLSCVTAGCMVVRKEAYLGIGGMDETFAVAFNDVDFCIRLRAAGWRIIWTPAVELYHRESISVGRHSAPERAQQFSMEVGRMRERWGPVLDFDPNYNVNLSLSAPFSLAFPPRQTLPHM